MPPACRGPVVLDAGDAIGDWIPGPFGPGRVVDTVEVIVDRGWVYARITSRLELEFGTTVPQTTIVTEPALLARLFTVIGHVVKA